MKLFAIGLLAISVALHAQQPTSTIAKDPAALTSLAQMRTATGWALKPNDVRLLATLSNGRGTRIVQIEAIDEQHYRHDAQDGTFTYVRAGDMAYFVQNNQKHAIRGEQAHATAPYELPFLTMLAAPDSAFSAVHDNGTTVVGGQSARELTLTRPGPAAGTHETTITVWLSPQTFLPLQIQYEASSEGAPNMHIVCTRTFGDYRTVGTILAPFAQQLSIAGQKIYSLQVTDASLNVGLNPNNFR